MRTLARLTFAAVACALGGVTVATAQPAPMGCSSTLSANATQTLRCPGELTIVAEGGAMFTLQSVDKSGSVNAVDLQSKALLIEAPRQQGKRRFQVTTPQAIAAVRGTKWAVDVQAARTSVLVLRGRVAVRRPGGAAQVVLGPGDGVDVEPGAVPLVVKRWPQPRVDALLARLGQ
jgi:hypothetical protein